MAISIAGKSAAIFVSTTSQASPLPTLPNGNIAKQVMVQATLTNLVYFKIGISSTVATISDTIAPVNAEPVLVQCDGATHIANRTPAGNASFIVTPIEV